MSDWTEEERQIAIRAAKDALKAQAADTPEPVRDLLDAKIRLADTERQLREAQKLSKYLEGALREIESLNACSCCALMRGPVIAAAALTPEPDEMTQDKAIRHQANEWADAATNGLQWLRNIKTGVSGVDEAITAMESDITHCRAVTQAMQEGKV